MSEAPFDVKLMNLTASVLLAACAAVLLAAALWWLVRNPTFAIGATPREHRCRPDGNGSIRCANETHS